MSTYQQNEYLFEVSWEVCNKVGGIYTVVSTKVPSMQKRFGEHYFAVGPDVWKDKANRDFIEDRDLYADWRKYAESQGIFFRIGRWNTAGSPIAVMVDYRSLISRKDDLLGAAWRDYNLDSISGQWDYIEPFLFGYAAGRLIQTFYEYHVFPQEKVYAHFHEWMTGAGLLFLKKNQPQVATLFTTHATVLGRCLAGNGMPLYGDLDKLDPDELSSRFGVRAKYSLEKLSAQHADCFTAVSEITNRECRAFLGKNIDVLTPNGFDDAFVPSMEDFAAKRKQAREKLREVTSQLMGEEVDDHTIFLINSGRYEFKNKGIDLFIDTLAALNKNLPDGKKAVAYLTVPAGHGPARQNLSAREPERDFEQRFCTHYLDDPYSDPILNRLKISGLNNAPEDKVKVVFVPCYLDGEDGVFNLAYYDLLIGFDMSVFPSYYEPWGYTPMESIAFCIPSVTTSLAGFGRWVKDHHPAQKSVKVIERDDYNSSEAVLEMETALHDFILLSDKEREECRADAYALSRHFLWSHLGEHYGQAYGKAAAKWEAEPSLLGKSLPASKDKIEYDTSSQPQWHKCMIEYRLPKKLERLRELSNNLWWCWDNQAQDMWAYIEPELWVECGHNPLALLRLLSAARLQELQNDAVFNKLLDEVYARFTAYIDEGKNKKSPKVAYFCMEYGLHESLKIYSGGLGILAGDYLKEASDANVDMLGVGLLYRYGYFEQKIDENGCQNARYVPQSFSKLPIVPVRDENGIWRTVSVSLPGRDLLAKIWRCDVGRVPLYLLDTDIDENIEADRCVTHQLYGGDWENRFKQEMLLGIGGIRMLRQLDIHPDVYHCNEGHGAFTLLERLRHYVSNGLEFWQARELVRNSSLFTTHTPVPAGHDAFDEDIVRTYLNAWADRLRISWEDFMALGRIDKNHIHDKFSMSHLAVNLSSAVNGVSRIHGRVSQEMFAPLYPGFYPQEVPVGYVTNGVHLATWAHKEWQELFAKYFGAGFQKDVSDASAWEAVQKIPAKELSDIRNRRRTELIDFVKERIQKEWPERGESPQNLIKAIHGLRPDVLTIGFARRFATYKRAHLLFKNLGRLSKIVNDPQHPVQFIFSGKAHPADGGGQALIRQIIEISQREEFLGKIVFLENYNIDVAKHMIQGVDVWMNTPTRLMEASGTSGEKALMNGGVNFSVLDGWWAEGYRKGAGWALREEQTYANQTYEDELDAETIYTMLEQEIVPAFYENGQAGSNDTWLQFVRNSFSQIAPHYTMRRQLKDYYNQYYNSLADRYKKLRADNLARVTDMTRWMIRIASAWNAIHVTDYDCPDSTNAPLQMGQAGHFGITLHLAGLNPDEIGVEVVFGHKENDQVKELIRTEDLKLEKFENGRATYAADLVLDGAGVFDYAFRMYPKNSEFPEQNKFRMNRWL